MNVEQDDNNINSVDNSKTQINPTIEDNIKTQTNSIIGNKTNNKNKVIAFVKTFLISTISFILGAVLNPIVEYYTTDKIKKPEDVIGKISPDTYRQAFADANKEKIEAFITLKEREPTQYKQIDFFNFGDPDDFQRYTTATFFLRKYVLSDYNFKFYKDNKKLLQQGEVCLKQDNYISMLNQNNTQQYYNIVRSVLNFYKKDYNISDEKHKFLLEICDNERKNFTKIERIIKEKTSSLDENIKNYQISFKNSGKEILEIENKIIGKEKCDEKYPVNPYTGINNLENIDCKSQFYLSDNQEEKYEELLLEQKSWENLKNEWSKIIKPI